MTEGKISRRRRHCCRHRRHCRRRRHCCRHRRHCRRGRHRCRHRRRDRRHRHRGRHRRLRCRHRRCPCQNHCRQNPSIRTRTHVSHVSWNVIS